MCVCVCVRVCVVLADSCLSKNVNMQSFDIFIQYIL